MKLRIASSLALLLLVVLPAHPQSTCITIVCPTNIIAECRSEFIGAPQSTLIRFEARGVCSQFGIFYPCGNNQQCYTPNQGNILFSTNKRWWE